MKTNKLFATMLVVMLAGMLLPIIPNVEAATSEPFIATIETTDGYALAGDSITYYLSLKNNLTVNQTFSISTSTPPENFTVSIDPEYVMVLPGNTYRYVEITVFVDDDANIGEDWDMQVRVDSGRGISETEVVTTTISAVIAGEVWWDGTDVLDVPTGSYGAFHFQMQNTGTIAWTAGQYIVKAYLHQYKDPLVGTWGTASYNYTGHDDYFIHYFADTAEDVTSADRYYTIPALLPSQYMDIYVHIVPTENTTLEWKSRLQLMLTTSDELYFETGHVNYLDISTHMGANTNVSGFYYNIDLDWYPFNPSNVPLIIDNSVYHFANLTNIGNDTTDIEVKWEIDWTPITGTTLQPLIYQSYFVVKLRVLTVPGNNLVLTLTKLANQAAAAMSGTLTGALALPVNNSYKLHLSLSIVSNVPSSAYSVLDGRQIVVNVTATCLNNATRSFTLDTADVGNISAPLSLTNILKQSYFGIPLYLWITLSLVAVVSVGYLGMRRKCDEPGYAKGHPKVCKKEKK